MDSTPMWSVGPYLLWRTEDGVELRVSTLASAHTHTHTHARTCARTHTKPFVAKLKVCVTQFGLCVSRSCSFGATTISYHFFQSGRVVKKKKKKLTHKSVAKT